MQLQKKLMLNIVLLIVSSCTTIIDGERLIENTVTQCGENACCHREFNKYYHYEINKSIWASIINKEYEMEYCGG